MFSQVGWSCLGWARAAVRSAPSPATLQYIQCSLCMQLCLLAFLVCLPALVVMAVDIRCRPDYFPVLLPLLSSAAASVRSAGARAVSGGMFRHQSSADGVIAALFSTFEKYSTPLALSNASSWITRHGVVSAIGAAATRRVCHS